MSPVDKIAFLRSTQGEGNYKLGDTLAFKMVQGHLRVVGQFFGATFKPLALV